MEDHRLTIFK